MIVPSYNTSFIPSQEFSGYDFVLCAIGREPLVSDLGLEVAGVRQGDKGYITVDDFQNTTAPGIYALGDVCGKVELTPMAIAAGRRLADRCQLRAGDPHYHSITIFYSSNSLDMTSCIF